MKATGVQSKLWGLLFEVVYPSNERRIAQLANLDNLCSAHPWTMEKYRSELSKDNVLCYSLHQNDRMVAYAIIHRSHLKGRVVDLLVHKDHRRAGVGRAMLKAIDDRFLNENRSTLEFVVSDRDLDAHLFLKACNVQAVEMVRGDKNDHYIFRASHGFSRREHGKSD
jgi:ribosomal protein S18 acetylase RimI-like enzyme